ncbi:MAG: two-component system response regulator CreB [Gammaproteobacteria bacterium]|mgnify:CR=1 FL=1|nr:two-component system response regulator CreB [Gammaproteobacteria bacterium]HXK55211.1 two-component system response regulator CreB [Gammaproteobacteria bacterium]
MDSIRIFIVEDEPSIAQTVQFTLEAEGFATQHFSTGAGCLAALEAAAPSLILLDVGLADGNGFELFGRIRRLTEAPVIYLTARDAEIDRVVGLEMGADDYIVKPFSLRELVARVRAVLRRVDTGAAASAGTNEVFQLDTVRRRIHYHAQLLDLTLHEYRLLETLLSHPERVFTRSQLLQRGWDNPDHRLERTIDSHIKSLRSKLHDIKPDADPICTHRGVGYSLMPES